MTVSGSNAADFSVTSQPATSLAASGSTTFTVEFTPGAAGLRSTQVNINSDDSDENPFDFAIQGTGVAPSPEIDIKGNGLAIGDGDSTPRVADGTDFEVVAPGGSSVDRSFTIENTGTATLTLGSNAVSITGGTADWQILSQPSTTVATGSSTSFTIRFQPAVSGTGVESATIEVANNDADENPYSFAVRAEYQAAAAPEIGITGNGSPIVSGDTTPSVVDGTEFGDQEVSTGTVSRFYTIENSGNAQLILGSNSVSITGANAGDFSVTVQPADTLAGGGSTTSFTVEFDPGRYRA